MTLYLHLQESPVEGEEVLGKGSRKESLASPISTGSVGEEPPAERYDWFLGALVPRPVFACALKCCKKKKRKEGGKEEGNAEESCHTPTGLIPRRRVIAVHQLLYNRTDTHTHTHN